MAGLIEHPGEYTGTTWDRLLTVKEAARYVPCSVQTIRRAYLVGQLPVERFGQGWGRVRIRQHALETWLGNGGRTQPATQTGGRDVSDEKL
jgi:excisionase family DNA binding protein